MVLRRRWTYVALFSTLAMIGAACSGGGSDKNASSKSGADQTQAAAPSAPSASPSTPSADNSSAAPAATPGNPTASRVAGLDRERRGGDPAVVSFGAGSRQHRRHGRQGTVGRQRFGARLAWPGRRTGR